MFLTESHRQTMRKQAGLLQRYLDAMECALKSQQDETVKQVALERTIHMSVELIIDMSNVLIDALIMRDPSSYSDIIDIMLDEKVMTEEVASQMQKAVRIRKELVHEYLTEPVPDLKDSAQLLEGFRLAKDQLLQYAGAKQ